MKTSHYALLGLAGFYLLVMVTSTLGIMNDYVLRVLNLILINIILGVSLNLINGYTGLFSIGHAGFMIVGGYVAGFMTTLLFGITRDTPYLQALPLFLVAILVAALVSALVGFFIGLPALRLSDDYLAIVTIGFGEIIRVVFNFITFKKKVGDWELDIGGPRGLLGIPPLSNFTIIFLFTLFTILFIRNFVFSRHGRACMAIRENEVAAHMMGINITRYKVLAFVLGSTFAGIGGALLAHFIQLLHPTMGGFTKSVEYLIIVYLGGMGSISGTIVAAAVLTALSEFLRPIGELRMVLYGALLVFLMLKRPAGLMGQREFPFLLPERERKSYAVQNR
ncbi:MAG: branched-chain amino acid ABC transporter permease [Spirochaetales bacterium]|nr:branched-chain amino acid ABC transporter permease [Spirochaetales bacterium]